MNIPEHLFGRQEVPEEAERPYLEDGLFSECRCIQAMLTFLTVGGKPREPSTLTIGRQGNFWFARLIDHDNERSMTVNAESLRDAFGILEGYLETGNQGLWFYWAKAKGQRSKKSGRYSGRNGG